MKRRLKKVHEIVNSPEYQGQDIHLEDDTDEDQYSTYEDDTHHDSPVNVTLDSISSLHSLHKGKDRIHADVKLNDSFKMKFKVDTGADTCVITTDDLQLLPFKWDLVPDSNILTGYGGTRIKNYGTVKLKVRFKDKSIMTKFNIVEAPGSPSMLGCSQSQELGIITVNVHDVKTTPTSSSTLKKEDILREYKDCFDKIGCFPGEKYHIKLIDNPQPVTHPARTVPVHLLPIYKEELDKMLAEDIITPVTEPTDWVNSIVCSIKEPPGEKKKARICLDPRDLNKNIKREHYYTRTIDEVLPQLFGKKFKTVIDTKKGYFHVPLDEESSYLCTFNTPFGRYRFKRLPFGVIVSQDIFQRKLDEVYRNIPGVTGIADDIIISGSTEEEHDEALIKMLEASRKNNIGLNSDKLQFKQKEVNFYGHTLTEKGIKPSTEKLEAIHNLKTPTNSKELLTILGMVTYLSRFTTKLAALTAPLRELTKKNVHFKWEKHHQAALDKIKEELCKAKVVSYYDPNPETPTILQTDASQVGLGAWIRQIDSNGNEKIVAMASRSLTQAESRYSNIERECLGVLFGLEKFEYYLLGRKVQVETDHSPLEQIFKKNIAEAPARLQRMLLRCLKFDIDVKYKKGKDIPMADALSRVCFKKINSIEVQQQDIHFLQDITCPVDIEVIKAVTAEDITMNRLKQTVYNGWPEYRKQCPQELWDYWNFRCDLVLEDGLILKGNRIVVPEGLRKKVLEAIHTGHQGETKCMLLARESVFWPGISTDIRKLVNDCELCQKHQKAQAKLPIMQPDLPTRPWEKLGTDIFEFNGRNYLMIVDYYSRFPVTRLLHDITADTVCEQFSSVIAEYGIPKEILSDFGSQYTSKQFKHKCQQLGIKLEYSSPEHHQANSLAEKSVGICKSIWKKAFCGKECPDTALWMYRITPLDSNLPSPYELLFGRKPKTVLPTTNTNLQSNHPDDEHHKIYNQARQEKQAEMYNRKVGMDRKVFNNMEPVYVRNTLKKIWEPGVILNRPNPIQKPRTYIVDIRGKIYYRTREYLRPRNAMDTEIIRERQTDIMPPPAEIMYNNAEAKPVTPPLPTSTEDQQKPQVITTTRPQPTPKKATSPMKDKASSEIIVVKGEKVTYQPKSQTTRSGRVTQVPAKFKD